MKKVIDIHEDDDGSRYIIHRKKKIEIPKGKTKKEDELIFATIMQMIIEDEKKRKKRKKRIAKKEAKVRTKSQGGITSSSSGSNPPPPLYIPGRVGPTVNTGLPQIAPTVNPQLTITVDQKDQKEQKAIENKAPPALLEHKGDIDVGRVRGLLMDDNSVAPVDDEMKIRFAQQQQRQAEELRRAIERANEAREREHKVREDAAARQLEMQRLQDEAAEKQRLQDEAAEKQRIQNAEAKRLADEETKNFNQKLVATQNKLWRSKAIETMKQGGRKVQEIIKLADDSNGTRKDVLDQRIKMAKLQKRIPDKTKPKTIAEMVDVLIQHNDPSTITELNAFAIHEKHLDDKEPLTDEEYAFISSLGDFQYKNHIEANRPPPLDMSSAKTEQKSDDEFSLGLSPTNSITFSEQGDTPRTSSLPRSRSTQSVPSVPTIKEETKDESEGRGVDDDDDKGKGLTNFEIDDMMRKRNSYAGTIPSDKIIEVIGPKMAQEKPKKVSFIMNLDTSDEPGSHWVAILIDPKKQRIMYFDSFGRPPTDQVKADLKSLVSGYGEPFKFKWNQIKWQDVRTDTCGYHAMLFLENMMDGKSFQQASGFNQARKGEKNVRKFKKSLEPFRDI